MKGVGVTHFLPSFIRKTSLSGTVSGLLMAAVIATASRARTGRGSMGINAVSHIIWGPTAGKQPHLSLRHTLPGFLLNQVACLFWALCYETTLRSQRPSVPARRILHALALSGLAYLVDYHVVPKRFTPGFEWVFTRAWFPGLYAGLAGSLWAGGQVSARLANKSRRAPLL
jgi:hypothetical protein